MIKLFTIITLLTVTSVTYAEETIPPLNLTVPQPLVLEAGDIIPENTTLFAFTTSQYGTILNLGVGHKLWSKNYSLRTKLDELWQLKLDIVKEGLAICNDSQKTLQEDREYTSKLFFNSQDQLRKQKIKNALKTILYTVGGIVVGGAIGIIIGATATN
jgi:hypothetical protein